MLVAGTVATFGSMLAGQLILPGHGVRAPLLSLANGADLRAALGSALYLRLIGLLASASLPPCATPGLRSGWC